MASMAPTRSLQFLNRASHCIKPATSAIREFSSIPPRKQEAQHEQYETDGDRPPRWSITPARMKAPYAIRIKDPEKAWECNSDPARLDKFYNSFLGRGGDNVLTEEVKWLAITHKSFDQGRRGFNDRLAFLGMMFL